MDYTHDLLMLPFDHRASFSNGLLGYNQPLTKIQHEHVSAFKTIVFEGFKKAYQQQRPEVKKSLGILVDEEFGTPILQECKKRNIIHAVSVEKSGQEFFDFEYGKKYGQHLLTLKPTFAKVLVRYNPETPGTGNTLQLNRLRTLSTFCNEHNINFMFELLVPPTTAQKRKYGKRYDTHARPTLMTRAITELLLHHITPSLWKIEALERLSDWESIITATRIKGGKPGIIVLGRGEDEFKVEQWLKIAATIPEVTGFAVGRTVFNPPLIAYRDHKITKKQAAARIAKNYSTLIHLWTHSRLKRT